MSTLTLDLLASHLLCLCPNESVPALSADVLVNPIDVYRCYLAEIFAQLLGCDTDKAQDAIQWTTVLANGDLTFVAPRLRIQGVNPAQLAGDLAAKFPSSALFKNPRPTGSFLPVFFSPETAPSFIIPYVFDRGPQYGENAQVGLLDRYDRFSARKKVLVEFSSPNIAKEFHAGHLRSTIIGAFISKLYSNMGWDVVKINYLGDWGKQFGLLAVGWERFGSEELFQNNPLGHLLDVYAQISKLFKPEQQASQDARDEGKDTSEIESSGLFAERNAFFKRMEDGEAEAIKLWKRFRNISIERYISTYARLNISFDQYSGESQVEDQTILRIEKSLKAQGLYTEDQGSWIIDFSKHGAPNLGVAVVRNRTGTTTYLLRDIAAAVERFEEHQFDKMIYVVAAEQDMYFRRLFKTIELMGRPDISSKLLHVNFGKVQGMSSRLGAVKLLGDILDECGAAMHEVMKTNQKKYSEVEDPDRIADILGITAVMAQDMSGKRNHNYPFDMARMTSFEGDTGPYLQYAHARLSSVIRKSGFEGDDLLNADFSLLTEQSAIDIVRLMARYPDVTRNALNTLEPTTILTYLFRFTHLISSSYDILKVIGAAEGEKVSKARAALYETARQVLENGMRLLGFTPVERM